MVSRVRARRIPRSDSTASLGAVGPPRPLLPMVLIALLGVLVAATAIGLFALWPTGQGRPSPSALRACGRTRRG
jgi:hypothetical protein